MPISAALLKSEVLVQQPTVLEPIVYVSEDEPESDKLPVPARLAIIGVGSVLAWAPLVLIGAALLG